MSFTALKTIETDFAAAMMARGARLDGWEKSADGRKLYWRLEQINADWIDDYRRGTDGIVRFVANRRMLVNVCKTEIDQNKSQEIHDEQERQKDHARERRPEAGGREGWQVDGPAVDLQYPDSA